MVTGDICKIESCKNILKKTEGHICQMHRSRFFRHGSYDISPNWANLKKGKPCLTKAGYLRINIDGKRVLQHRHIMEQHLGRKLAKNERVHHINGIGTDNRIENLELFKTNTEHMMTHHSDGWKNRKKGSEYSPEDIGIIIVRVSMPTRSYDNCYCGRKYFAKNLCEKHYQWAYDHNFR